MLRTLRLRLKNGFLIKKRMIKKKGLGRQEKTLSFPKKAMYRV